MNKLRSFSLLLVFCALFVNANSFEVDGLWYEMTSDETVSVVEIPSSYEGGTSFIIRYFYEGDIVIPQTVTYQDVTYVVTAVKEGTFRNSKNLTSVSLPASLIEVGNAPFADCPNLTSVMVEAGNSAFSDANGLFCDKELTTLIACPGAKETIDVIPSTVRTIAESAFQGGHITSVSIPQNASEIGKCAFMNCSMLSDVTLPDGLQAINDSVFYGCTSLTDVVLPETVSSIGIRAFYYCKSITTILLPKALVSIANEAFNMCYGLNSVSFSEGLKQIGSWAFDNCSNIRNVKIPSTASDIASTAFSGCSGLRSIVVAGGNTSYKSLDGVLFDKEMKTLVCYPGAKYGAYIVPSSVKTIGEYSFYYSKQLKNITIPSSVTSIGHNAFRLCTALTSITLPSSVTTLGDNLFRACSALQSIVYYADTPPEISASTFTSGNYNVPLYVLKRALDDYKNAPYWSQFATILPIDGTVVDGLLGDVNNDGYINMSDVTVIINYILGREVNDFRWQQADMNFDGFINMSDVTGVINFILGKTTEDTEE